MQPTSIGETHNSAAVLTLGYTYGTTNNNGNVSTHTVTSDAQFVANSEFCAGK